MGKEKDYSKISPSARALMLFKAHTAIPYALEAAQVLFGSNFREGMPELDFGFWASVVHFENRYESINALVKEVDNKNVLELCSGYNFRSLDLVNQVKGCHYIDTDLPDVIETKKELVSSLGIKSNGHLEYDVLNALEGEVFSSMMNRFDDGSVTIVNEGLLVYLSTKEKAELCRIIRRELEKRGGCWVTSDIYIKHKTNQVGSDKDGKWAKFFGKLNVDQQMFDSFDQAEEFFDYNGFKVEKEYEPDYRVLSSAQHLVSCATPEQMAMLAEAGKVQATWRLVLK